MKKILILVLALAFAGYGSVAMADDSDVTISLSKVSDTKAKVSVWPDAQKTCVVKIKFSCCSNWDNVKDSYTVSPDVAAGLAAGKFFIAISNDGTAAFHKSKQ